MPGGMAGVGWQRWGVGGKAQVRAQECTRSGCELWERECGVELAG